MIMSGNSVSQTPNCSGATADHWPSSRRRFHMGLIRSCAAKFFDRNHRLDELASHRLIIRAESEFGTQRMIPFCSLAPTMTSCRMMNFRTMRGRCGKSPTQEDYPGCATSVSAGASSPSASSCARSARRMGQRDHQIETSQAIADHIAEGGTTGYAVIPTGGGKTRIFMLYPLDPSR